MRGYKIISKRGETSTVSLFGLLHALKDEVIRYRWSVSDADLWPAPSHCDEICEEMLQRATQDVLWLSGDELYKRSKVISVSNWGAFLAFEPENADFQYEKFPCSEGRPPSIQHPNAVTEIQAVDGGYFEVFTRRESMDTLLNQQFNIEVVYSN